eukprot:gene10594-10752_t
MTLRPGKVVWARVEGHDWWPARVVRRRAVPKEVGPPPGGQAAVMDSIPVVFFTAKGIPGEVEERLDTPAGLVAASMRALGLGDEKGDEEAEYAWLPYDNIKPFKLGDGGLMQIRAATQTAAGVWQERAMEDQTCGAVWDWGKEALAPEPEYLVKWFGRAHIHNEWLPESRLLILTRRKLLNFKKRHGDAPCNFMEDEWTVPERLVARRPCPNSPGWEVLVKWKAQVSAKRFCGAG